MEIKDIDSSNLTIVGVGPGDPSLITLAAIKAIEDATMIAYPISHKGAQSIAANIASQWITEDKKRLPLLFPMGEEAKSRNKAWKDASEELAFYVNKGEQVAFICIGDPSLFATGSYVLRHLKANSPQLAIKVIPGVTSISAAAARGLWPLCFQKEQLLIQATPETSEQFQSLLDEARKTGRVLALLKLGERWQWVKPILEKNHLLNNSLFAQRVGFADEEVLKASEIDEKLKPYFSLLIICQTDLR